MLTAARNNTQFINEFTTMNFSTIYAIVMALLVMTLVGQTENTIYSQSALSSPDGIRTALVRKYSSIERSYEYFDKKRGRAITVYFNKENSKAIVIFGGNGMKIRCYVDEKEVDNLSGIFESEQVLAFAQDVHYSSNGKRKGATRLRVRVLV